VIERLVAIMARLRDPVSGCEWDRVQTWSTIAPYTIEEAYEVADAIERNDSGDLKDELGDLLLQVVFHSRIAEEAGHFALADVVDAVSDKMERRHPHIFGDATTSPGWEALKATERAAKPDPSALAGVPIGLPALVRAEKLQKRAARVGFDWPNPQGSLDKVNEEIAEVQSAGPDTVAEEIGDLLFAVTNWARHLGIDPEAALRAGNAKFERRFRAMEAEAGGDGRFADLDFAQQEALWQAVKHRGG
jgi:ATP diphosphatase